MEKAFMKIWIGKEVNHKISLFELYKEADEKLAKLIEIMKTDPMIIISEAIESYYQETFSFSNTKKPSLASASEPSIESSVEPSVETSIKTS